MKNTLGRRLSPFSLLLLFFLASHTGAESRFVDIALRSVALGNNLLGDPPNRNIRIYLPPDYDANLERRYPVIYLLHGFTGTNRSWELLANLKRRTDTLIEQGTIRPMIIVMPDAFNKYRGSFYTNSLVTGNWEDFITAELVQYIDSTYRTLAQTSSRGIAGHSMGGYGALKLAMKHPEIYSAVYGLSACCVGFVERQVDWSINDAAWSATLQFAAADSFASANFAVQSHIAAAAAMSPNPESPPFFVDFPFELVEGEVQTVESVWQQWKTHMPLHMLPQYENNLRQFSGIRFDVGRSDRFPHIPVDNRAFSAALTEAGIKHVFEEYDGNHTNRIGQRIETAAWPFFSEVLNFAAELPAVEESTWGIVKSGFLSQ